jgi:diadenosine tetraphosphate (Ap4A) HIT family hydrolase
MPTLIHRRVAEAQAGTNPKVICRVRSGWVVIGDVQFLRGYCLLLPDPVVGSLNELTRPQRTLFLSEMTLLGDALLALTGAARINYEILGNTENALHAHVFPRYHDEPIEQRIKPAWFYDWKQAPAFDAQRDGPLMAQIAAFLNDAGATQDV